MLDINGQEIRKGALASLLCEVLDVQDDHVHLRVLNSDHELAVGARNDEAFGDLVADSELTAFLEEPLAAPGPIPAESWAEHEVEAINPT